MSAGNSILHVDEERGKTYQGSPEDSKIDLNNSYNKTLNNEFIRPERARSKAPHFKETG